MEDVEVSRNCFHTEDDLLFDDSFSHSTFLFLANPSRTSWISADIWV